MPFVIRCLPATVAWYARFVNRIPGPALLAGAILTALGLVACAEPETDGPESGVTVNDIQESQNYFEGDYLGQQVTVRATVTEVLGPRSFELDGAGYGDDSLLVQTPESVVVEEGQIVTVSGIVGQFHRLSEDDYAPGSYDLYEEYETEAYVYGAVVEVLSENGR